MGYKGRALQNRRLFLCEYGSQRARAEHGAQICLLSVSSSHASGSRRQLCPGSQDGLGVLHLGRFQTEVNFPFCQSYVCSKKTGLLVFELVQSGKLSVKTDCGLRFYQIQLFVSCWLNRFNFELSWLKHPYKPPALV